MFNQTKGKYPKHKTSEAVSGVPYHCTEEQSNGMTGMTSVDVFR